MGFFGLLWKNNIQKAYLPTISIPGQIVFVILAQLCSDYSKKTLLNLTQWSSVHNIRNRVKLQGRPGGGGGSGIPVYQKKIHQNTPKYPKFIQIYPKL